MTPDHRQNPKLLWGIVSGLIVVIIAVWIIIQFFLTQNETLPTHQGDLINAPAPQTISENSEKATKPEVTDALSSDNVLVDASIMTEEVTSNATLAKEEIARLEDIQLQLDEQEKSLKQQHSTADDLIKLKEEQIKLLEAQLAQ
ncbi:MULTISPECIES: hypothetical protein [Acinetobacter]|uniref:Uncharacterized protein n=1 Tax=Acinetobacter pecorum TaxID=2762215 RepID=A0ABR8VXQ7_9GAMM|nr:hypothetical protein [Acinetobacter sp. SFA]MBD8009555.1 hypothetical protein [Acinetobacter pecorum]OAL78886.1 hypothetical protein AY607_06165 [Acinetobacter sp. SFA]